MREIELHIDGDGLAPRLFVDTDFESMGVRYLTNCLWPILYMCPRCNNTLEWFGGAFFMRRLAALASLTTSTSAWSGRARGEKSAPRGTMRNHLAPLLV